MAAVAAGHVIGGRGGGGEGVRVAMALASPRFVDDFLCNLGAAAALAALEAVGEK